MSQKIQANSLRVRPSDRLGCSGDVQATLRRACALPAVFADHLTTGRA